MNESRHQLEDRLSRIETLWSVIDRAHRPDTTHSAVAKQQLLDRYSGAIQRYLMGAVRNRDLADDLFQEFSMKFLRGDFQSADPKKGKFRSFVKTVLFRMVALHFRKQSASKVSSMAEVPEFATANEEAIHADDQLYLNSWRDDLLAQTWEALSNQELAGGSRHYSILRTRVENPAADSNELAELLTKIMEKTISSGNARVQIHRAREAFACELIERIADSLPLANHETIESELLELKLAEYCRDALKKSYQ